MGLYTRQGGGLSHTPRVLGPEGTHFDMQAGQVSQDLLELELSSLVH